MLGVWDWKGPNFSPLMEKELSLKSLDYLLELKGEKAVRPRKQRAGGASLLIFPLLSVNYCHPSHPWPAGLSPCSRRHGPGPSSSFASYGFESPTLSGTTLSPREGIRRLPVGSCALSGPLDRGCSTGSQTGVDHSGGRAVSWTGRRC